MNALPQYQSTRSDLFNKVVSGGAKTNFAGAAHALDDRTAVVFVMGAMTWGYCIPAPLAFSNPEIQQWTKAVQGFDDERLRLRHPLWVTVYLSAGVWTVWHEDLEEFGYGDSEAAAFADFRASVADLYFWFKEQNESNLGPLLQRQWRCLRDLIEER